MSGHPPYKESRRKATVVESRSHSDDHRVRRPEFGKVNHGSPRVSWAGGCWSIPQTRHIELQCCASD